MKIERAYRMRRLRPMLLFGLVGIIALYFLIPYVLAFVLAFMNSQSGLNDPLPPPDIAAVDSYQFAPNTATVTLFVTHWPQLQQPTIIGISNKAARAVHHWVLTQDNATVVSQLVARATTQPNYQPEQDGAVLASSNMLHPGSTQYVALPTTPGTYRYICIVPGHYAAGMQGVLVLVRSE